MTGDEFYELEEQIVSLRRQVLEHTDQLARIVEDLRMVRYDLDVLDGK